MLIPARKKTRDKVKAICSIHECGRVSTAHGWCQKHYMRVRQSGKMDEPAKTPLERLLKNVQYEPNTGCWIREKSHTEFGHALIKYGDKLIYAHRLSWMIHKGDIPQGLCVLHKCDMPACINPDHLFIGTLKDNTQDMIKKGRWRGRK